MSDGGSKAQEAPGARIADRLREQRLVAIVRGHGVAPEAVLSTVVTLVEEGVGLVEVSLTTPGALAAISRARQEVGGRARVGAGTVLSAEDARRAADAGAQFLLSPGVPDDLPDVLAVGLDTVVGALTPSEVGRALRAGAAAVKVFPVDAVGAGYLRSLLGPFPGTCLVAVGGVRLESCAALLAAGAAAVGVGSPLVGDAADGGDLGALRERARAYRAAVTS